MQGKIQKDGTILIRLDKKADKDLYAQTVTTPSLLGNGFSVQHQGGA